VGTSATKRYICAPLNGTKALRVICVDVLADITHTRRACGHSHGKLELTRMVDPLHTLNITYRVGASPEN
jgi:hypothetical protein